MKITFEKSEIRKLIELTEKSRSHTIPYTGKAWNTPPETVPGLLLVGDRGVYFLSNGDDIEKEPETDHYPRAYANECNPERMLPETVYRNKRRIFGGGDDGAQFFPLTQVKKWIEAGGGNDALVLDISETEISFEISK